MNARFFQQLILQMKDVMNRHLGMITDGGFVISSKEGCISPNDLNCVLSFTEENTDTFTYNGFTYKPVLNMNKVDYIIFIQGDDTLAKNYINILQVSFSGVKSLYDDKHDRVNFIKNIILDNILSGDVLAKAAELHFPIEGKRAVYLIRSDKDTDFSSFEIIENMFPDKQNDFIVSIDQSSIVLVKSFPDDAENIVLEDIAHEIHNNLMSENLMKVTIGIGTLINNVREIARSFKEARVALEVGKVFDNEKSIISYDNLGIGRLIYQLPTTLCELFLSEVFKRGSIDDLDQEIVFTIQKFFENNLNVSETSRQLYVHRNTLVYRLDKIQKITGLDLRIFDEAIIFKVAMMVNKYLQSNAIRI
ncbi:PucR family transcriptional regulator [Qingrenia yutianensis]|mgnify:CR=1 FL=1|uniref:Helix-turn-helix domain-containing protein n=1 Tax=Qingrenia yutianensis TaxID=2763676 RepID=A0A926FCD6_9FIRM|nr:helix-turn-helix domain-containing protein [Qingrenia yutianensis]MBC8596122.1 helix-turn-helix domain-containing protein [Qingrenia yutianensis]